MLFSDYPVAPFIPGRLREFDCRSAKAFRRLQNWIQTCDAQHDCAPVEPNLPKRVLDLGTDSSFRMITLLETETQHGQYIALSHCWGRPEKQFTTTTATLEDRKQGIDV